MKNRMECMLIVDDDFFTLGIAAKYARKIGLASLTVSSYRQAVEALNRNPHIRIFLCDKNLRGEDGALLVMKAKELNPRIVAVGMSGSDEAEQEFKKSGARYFIPKPFVFEQFKTTFEEIFENEQIVLEKK